MQIQIYNQWGLLVFASNSQDNSWDGTKDNNIQPAGNYAYFLVYTTLNNEEFKLSGTITLLR